MTKLNEMAKAYEHKKMKNIADLERIPIDVEINNKTLKDKDGKEFKVNFINFNGEEYRVPNIVLEELKGILSKLPDTKAIQVLKSGSEKNTKYQVLPML